MDQTGIKILGEKRRRRRKKEFKKKKVRWLTSVERFSRIRCHGPGTSLSFLTKTL